MIASFLMIRLLLYGFFLSSYGTCGLNISYVVEEKALYIWVKFSTLNSPKCPFLTNQVIIKTISHHSFDIMEQKPSFILRLFEYGFNVDPISDAAIYTLIGILLVSDPASRRIGHQYFMKSCESTNYSGWEYILNAASTAFDRQTSSTTIAKGLQGHTQNLKM